ncbi:MAG: asparagine synthase (glutamine-hydrolyzing) [Planctomycetota bacterium]|nr:asparagine synthase (glutamine-hydrolyzing) [Planctomycetota bacterium]
MCGIAAIVGRDPRAVETALDAATCAQIHRGPDDSGIELVTLGDITVGLGQRRLSIIDLSPLGHQPMAHPETGDLLIYNGELYNFQVFRAELEQLGVRFRGRSDTEVMLHALVRWGPDVLRRFQGMYAIVWLRRAARTIVLARDPLGIKPLFVARSAGMLAAASEVRALVASGVASRTISRRAVATMLAYGAVQEPATIFEDVYAFPAGSFQEISLDSVLDRAPKPPTRYWRPPPVDNTIDETEATERIRETLTASVRDHLVSDVPVGVFLSSGLDSTIIAGLAARHISDIRAYTVGFEENPDMSESAPAARTAQAFGIPHVDVQITAQEALGSVEHWLRALDQPSIDGLNTYVVSGAVKRAGITVALSGLGGDELFCGYTSFVDVPRLQGLMRHIRFMPRPARTLLARLAAVGRPYAYRQKLMEIAESSGTLADLYFQRRRTMSARQLAALGLKADEMGLSPEFIPPEALENVEIDELDPVVSVSRLEMAFYDGNMLLRDSDTNGMAHSLEIRVPFFDTAVLNAVMPIPAAVRMPHWRANKHLLRHTFPELLRPELLTLGKRGFSLPIRRWMASSLRDLCESSLAALRGCGLLSSGGIDTVWRAFLAEPETPIWSRAWGLCVLGAYVSSINTPVTPRAPLPRPSSTPTAV